MSCGQFAAGMEAADPNEQLQGQDDLVKIIYFSSASCENCLKFKKALPEIIAGFEEFISIKEYDIDDSKTTNLEKFLEYCEKYEIEEEVAPPVIFIGNKSLIEVDAIIEKLQETIIDEMADPTLPPGTAIAEPNDPAEQTSDTTPLQNTTEEPNDSSATGSIPPEPNILPPEPNLLPQEPNLLPPEPAKPRSRIMEKFNKFSIGAIVLAGLVDGINPCAFTTIIFFISMLSYLGKTKYQLIVVGVGFTLSVFVTYLLLGLGLLGAAKSFLVGHGVSKIVTYIVVVFTFILAGWSFVDFVNYMRTKSVKSMTLGLPKSIKAKIHKVIRVGIGTRGLVFGSLSVGAFVAILESVCTGQVYLPIIMYVARSSTLRMTAISYLILYNLMFILPLVIVLIITYFGVKSETLGNFFGRHLGTSKLIMTLLFLGLGILLLVT